MNHKVQPSRFEQPEGLAEVSPGNESSTASPDQTIADTNVRAKEIVPEVSPLKAPEAMKLLKAGAKKKIPVTIAGEVFENPEAARTNFINAVKLAKQKMKGYANVDMEVIGFKAMAGDEAGESIENTVVLDPKVLNQPVEILAMLIAHEFGHQFGAVENEGMIQALVEVLFENKNMPHTYQDKVTKFNKFAEIFDQRWFRKSDYKRGVKEIYRSFMAGNLGQIREIFISNYTKILRREKKVKKDYAKLEAERFFKDVFPEIQESGGEGDQSADNVVNLRNSVNQKATVTAKPRQPSNEDEKLDLAA